MKLSKRILKSNQFMGLVATLASWYIRFVGITTRWKVTNAGVLGAHAGKPWILAFWHGRSLLVPYCTMPYCYPKPGMNIANVLVSNSSDGEIQARIQQKFHFKLIRGSTRKAGKLEDKGGSRAIREMIKAKARNEVIVFSPDGPRGPLRKVNGQVTKIAEMLELPIIPICYSVKRRKILNNWDQYMFPKPFNKGVFLVGNPIPPERANDLEFELNKLTDEADFAAANL